MLRVAIGEDDAAAEFLEPDGEMDGERRFADASFGIGDNDNHARTLITIHVRLQAGRSAVGSAGTSAGVPAWRPSYRQAGQFVSMRANRTADRLTDTRGGTNAGRLVER